MKNCGIRQSYIRQVCPRNVCDQKIYLTPKSRQYGVNLSGDMNVELVNVEGTKPNCQKKDGMHESGQGQCTRGR